MILPVPAVLVRPFVAELLAFTGDEKKDSFSDQVDMLVWADFMRKNAGPHFAGMPNVPTPSPANWKIGVTTNAPTEGRERALREVG